jgi:hypothetical protein
MHIFSLEVEMAMPMFADPANLVEDERPILPDNVTALPLLQMAYRGKVQLTPQQMRAAIESLPYETPKLSASAIAMIDGKTFAEQLDRCIERSRSPLQLNGNQHEELVPASELKRPFPRNYRRF